MKPEMKVLYRDYMPQDLEPSLKRHKIDKTVLVQAAPTVAETDFLLEIAETYDFVAGVVGWLDFESEDFQSLFERYRRNRKFIGIRPMLEELADDDWILRPQVLEPLQLIAEADFPFDFLVKPRHLSYVAKALEAVPGLRAVIDHIAKPEIRAQEFEPWKSMIRELAQHKNLYCKLSGMVTEARHDLWKPEDLRPYIEHVVECFGPDRVMYGSDWPVCLLAGSYDQVIGVLESILNPRLDNASLEAIYGDNAARFYKLKF